MMWNLQSYPTTVLNEKNLTFIGGGSPNILWPSYIFSGGHDPQPQDLRQPLATECASYRDAFSVRQQRFPGVVKASDAVQQQQQQKAATCCQPVRLAATERSTCQLQQHCQLSATHIGACWSLCSHDKLHFFVFVRLFLHFSSCFLRIYVHQIPILFTRNRQWIYFTGFYPKKSPNKYFCCITVVWLWFTTTVYCWLLMVVFQRHGTGSSGDHWHPATERETWSSWTWRISSAVFFGSCFLGVDRRVEAQGHAGGRC